METGDVKIDIITKTYTQTSSLPLSFNNVCINLFHQYKRLVIDKSGRVTCTGFYPAPPLTISQIRLHLFNYEFTSFHLFPLLNSRLHDPSLSKYIAEVISARSILSVGFVKPLFMSVTVVFTEELFSVIPVSRLPKEETKEVADAATCPICLEDLWNDDTNMEKLPHCSHRFHRQCIVEWLMRCNSCPLCRRIVLEESQYFKFFA